MTGEGVCIVCGHPLGRHVHEPAISGESGGWRCHALAVDGFQCECFLRDRGDPGEQLKYYDQAKRLEAVIR